MRTFADRSYSKRLVAWKLFCCTCFCIVWVLTTDWRARQVDKQNLLKLLFSFEFPILKSQVKNTREESDQWHFWPAQVYDLSYEAHTLCAWMQNVKIQNEYICLLDILGKGPFLSLYLEKMILFSCKSTTVRVSELIKQLSWTAEETAMMRNGRLFGCTRSYCTVLYCTCT